MTEHLATTIMLLVPPPASSAALTGMSLTALVEADLEAQYTTVAAQIMAKRLAIDPHSLANLWPDPMKTLLEE